jgi:uncharacterized protein (TIGR02145 family)
MIIMSNLSYFCAAKQTKTPKRMKPKLIFFGMLAAATMSAAMLVGCDKSQEIPWYTINVVDATGGKIVMNVDGQQMTEHRFQRANEGPNLTLTATPDKGYLFVRWIISDGNGWSMTDYLSSHNTENPLTFQRINGGATFSAEYEKVPQVEEGVWINGVVWAESNVDTPEKFAKKPEDAGMFYLWNERLAWSTEDPKYATDGTTYWQNAELVWNDTGAEDWTPENDPCPEGWRVPSYREFNGLINGLNMTGEWVAATGNSLAGWKFTYGNTDESIFLPAAGMRHGFFDAEPGSLDKVGIEGHYWAAGDGHRLEFTDSGVQCSTSSLAITSRAYSVRCVAG